MKKEKKNLPKIIAGLLFFLFPFLVTACPLCQGGGYSEASIFAYKLSTALLMLLPFLIAIGIYLWIKRKFRQAE